MKRRREILDEILTRESFDVAVIGGGATGIGTALESVLRGYKTVLFERSDFTKGTSSKSTKLVHGGVRYLAQGDLKLVREALKERGILLKNAPHLVHNQSFIIPVYTWWDALLYTIGLGFYDLLSGRYSLGRSLFLRKTKIKKRMPGISDKALKGGVLYHDGQFDDSRLAMDLLHAFEEKGGLAINYCGVSNLIKDANNKISGVEVKDMESGSSYKIQSRTVINATGVWVDEVLSMDVPEHRKLIMPSQGIHLVINRDFLPGDHALMIPKTSDGRVLFAVPWHDHLVVGTTDTPMKESSEEPVALEKEIQFILDTASAYFNAKVQRKDVLSIFAGLRPLAAPKTDTSKTKEISRNHKIITSQSGLITVIGGKWTTYRRMAEDIIDAGIKNKLLPASKSISKQYVLSKNQSTTEAGHLSMYGKSQGSVKELIEADPNLGEKLHPEFTYTLAELHWICKNEMVVHLEDIMARRLRMLLLNAKIASDLAEIVAEEIAPLLDWNKERVDKEVKDFRSLALKYLPRQ